LYHDRRSVCQPVSELSTYLKLTNKFVLLSDSCGFVDRVGGTLSDERKGLSFTIATGLASAVILRVQVPWDSRPHFTVSDSRLPFSTPPTTRRVTVEVIEPASTQDTESISKSKSKLYYDLRSVSQSVLEKKAPIWGLRPDFYYCHTVAGLLMWGALSDERTGLSFTIVAGPRQRSHSRLRYFAVSGSRLLQSGGPGPRIYIPQVQGGPVIPPSIGFPFRRPLRLPGL
jgi:hypothetical protein